MSNSHQPSPLPFRPIFLIPQLSPLKASRIFKDANPFTLSVDDLFDVKPLDPIDTEDQRQSEIDFETSNDALKYILNLQITNAIKELNLQSSNSVMNAYERLFRKDYDLINSLRETKLKARQLENLLQSCPSTTLFNKLEMQKRLSIILLRNGIFGSEVETQDLEMSDEAQKNQLLNAVLALVNICCLYSDLMEMNQLAYLEITQSSKQNIKDQRICEEVLKLLDSYRG